MSHVSRMKNRVSHMVESCLTRDVQCVCVCMCVCMCVYVCVCVCVCILV